MYLKQFLFSCLLFFFSQAGSAQLISNGNFSSGTTSWSCGIEVNTESTYGGSGSNAVVEVDAGAGLCQTVNGLTIGNTYQLSFSASRRTGGCPSPATTNIDITVSGGVFAATVTRTNTTFGFTTNSYLFTANSATHTITFAAGSGFGGSTCGMIMDDFALAFSPLPIELLNFDADYKTNAIEFNWSTATEKNNAYFVIQKSNNGIDFMDLLTIPSKALQGNSSIQLNYSSKDISPENGLIYYRLKQVDLDKTVSYSDVIVISTSFKENKLYPNPNSGEFSIDLKIKGKVSVSIMNHLEESVYTESQVLSSESESLKINAKDKLSTGYYHCLVTAAFTSYYFPLIIH